MRMRRRDEEESDSPMEPYVTTKVLAMFLWWLSFTRPVQAGALLLLFILSVHFSFRDSVHWFVMRVVLRADF